MWNPELLVLLDKYFQKKKYYILKFSRRPELLQASIIGKQVRQAEHRFYTDQPTFSHILLTLFSKIMTRF